MVPKMVLEMISSMQRLIMKLDIDDVVRILICNLNDAKHVESCQDQSVHLVVKILVIFPHLDSAFYCGKA